MQELHNQSLTQMMGIDLNEQLERKNFVNFTTEDARVLKTLRPLIDAHSDSIVNLFYDKVVRHQELKKIIQQANSSIDLLKITQKRYLLEMFDGEYGDAYFERRLKVGIIHNKIGLTPRWYLGSYSIYSQAFTQLILNHYRWNTGLRAAALQAVHKIISIDAQLAMDTYIHSMMDDLRRAHNVSARVSDYRAFIAAMAAGDVSQRLEIIDDDALGQLGSSLNLMAETLMEASVGTRDMFNTIYRNIDHLNHSVITQSVAASEQATAVGEATTSLNQIKNRVVQAMERVQILGEAIERSQHESEQGNLAVAQTRVGMAAILQRMEGIAQTIVALSEQIQQIGEITEVVTHLAQQSKMLALNASIEAAKAGVTGKGFAVVAAEVRELAEQSEQATAQVQRILQDIRHATDRAVIATEEGSKGMDAGMVSVQRSDEVMQKLSTVVCEIAMLSQQISTAVKQQLLDIEQMTTSMHDIHQTTSQFATSTQDRRALFEDVGTLADQLRDKVSSYKL